MKAILNYNASREKKGKICNKQEKGLYYEIRISQNNELRLRTNSLCEVEALLWARNALADLAKNEYLR